MHEVVLTVHPSDGEGFAEAAFSRPPVELTISVTPKGNSLSGTINASLLRLSDDDL
jgi:hypothetical protein